MKHWTKTTVWLNLGTELLLFSLIATLELTKPLKDPVIQSIMVIFMLFCSWHLMEPIQTLGPWYLLRGIMFSFFLGITADFAIFWFLGGVTPTVGSIVIASSIFFGIIFTMGIQQSMEEIDHWEKVRHNG